MTERDPFPNFDMIGAYPEQEISGLDANYHQGFGYSCRDNDGRLYLGWRKGDSHGIVGAGSIVMKRMDNDGFSTVDVRTVLTPDAGRDLRDPMPVVTPTGRVVLVWSDTSATNSNGGTDDTFYRSMYSDDRGETWGAPVTIATIPFNYARVYGGLKVWPSTDPGRQWEVGFTAYHQTGVGAWELTFYVSRDDGETFQSATDIGESVISPTPHNETSMDGVNASVWFAATRASDAIHIKYSTDGRQTWSAFDTIPWTVGGVHVAPCLDVVQDSKGRPWVLIGVSDRTNDWMEWSAALASDVINVGAAAFSLPVKAHTTTNAYPSTIIYPNGNLLYSFTREYPGNSYASYHLGYFNYGDLIETRGAFRLHKDGVNQSGFSVGIATKVTFGGGSFSTDGTTSGGTFIARRKGIVSLSSQIYVSAGSANESFVMDIRKNSGASFSVIASTIHRAVSASPFSIGVSAFDECMPGDMYEVYLTPLNGPSKTVFGAPTQSWFIGYMVE